LKRHPAILHRGIGLAAAAAALTLLPAMTPAPPRSAPATLEPDTIGLIGTARASGARGYVRITSTPSPFTMSVTAAGNLVLTLDFVIEGLLDPAPLGGDTYVAWVASPQLDTYRRIGPLEANARVRGSTDLPKWLAVITVETGPGGERPAGPIVVHGLSPSGRLQSFQGHELFNGPKIGAAGPAPALRVVNHTFVDDAPDAIRYTFADGSVVTRRAPW
jgi:hypothetical protein